VTVTDHSTVRPEKPLLVANEKIRLGPVPDWVKLYSFSCDFAGDAGASITHLLFEQQIHAELHQTVFHGARRLQTAQAVQEQSPWHLDFDARQERVILHWIKTRRDGKQFEHTNLSSARVVDESAVGAAGPGRMTLALMLEDVRPGDIVEWCYTIETRRLILPQVCAALFRMPAEAPVGKFYFSAQFNPERHMQWKAWKPEWKPTEQKEGGEVCWIWTRENYEGFHAEDNSPGWLMAYPWIQISDCGDWERVAAAFVEAWKNRNENTAAGLVTPSGGEILEQIARIIRIVQDEYRFLPADGELDGELPTPAGVVARRRYGSGKDLSFLLIDLLKQLQIPARPVLVNTTLRRSLAGLLPSPGLFNHLLVEYEVGGETRWADVAGEQQAGGYGAGLTAGGLRSGLMESPDEADGRNVCELKETILLDTTGSWSWLEVVVAARGVQAEALRRELESEGLEAFARKRLRQYENRFNKARRMGELKYRDDRTANEFFLAEVFEINDFLVLEPKSKCCRLEMSNNFIADFLQKPGGGPRRMPFGLPYPCHIAHTIELYSVTLPPMASQQLSVGTNFLRFMHHRRAHTGNWTLKLMLSTLADAVPPEALDEHSHALKKIQAQSVWSLLLPVGESRPHQRGDFGTLPEKWTPMVFTRPPARAATPGAITTAPTTTSKPATAILATGATEPKKTGRRRHKHCRRKDGRELEARRMIPLACFLGLTLIIIVVVVARYADNWNIFQTHTPHISLPENQILGH
jgi:transglutaminase-like putative cysteine protease